MEVIKVNPDGSKLIFEDGEYYTYTPYNICRVCNRTYDETVVKNHNLCGCCYARQYKQKYPEKHKKQQQEYYNKNREQLLLNQMMRRLFIKLFQEE